MTFRFSFLRISIFLLLIISCSKDQESNVVVTTLAGGTGGCGYDDGKGSSVKFNNPVGIDVDAEGNTYVADTFNNRIRKIDSDGTVTTIAGSSIVGYLDGPVSQAKFNQPIDVVVDDMGNIYVADYLNYKIRKIDKAGIVSTIAGSTIGYLDGVGLEAKFTHLIDIAIYDEAIYVNDVSDDVGNNSKIRKITSDGNVTTLGLVNETGTPVKIGRINGLTIDAMGNIFVAAEENSLILKISPDLLVTTFSGRIYGYADGTIASALFQNPNSIACDALNNFYIGDYSGEYSRIRKIDANGKVTTIAGGGIGYKDGYGVNSKFHYLTDLDIDPEGNLIISDQLNCLIRIVTFK